MRPAVRPAPAPDRTPRGGAAGRRRLVGLVLASWVPFLAACGDQGPQSGPGTRTVAVVSPAGAEGAALLELKGAGIEAVLPIDAQVFHHARGDTVRIVVVREDAGELRFAVELADTLAPPAGAVLEVADGENGLRSGLGGYSVEIRR